MTNELKALREAVLEAGEAILGLQKTGFTVAKKANNDIVTKADLLANEILKTQLCGQFPAIGWLSEESVDDSSRLECERVWVVDPIDGTKEYAYGIPEYAISVALVEKGKPVLSAVFNPATNEFFHAIKNEGAWLNNQKIVCTPDVTSNPFLLLASRSEYKRGEWERFQQHQIKQVGSIAYKLALIAAGQGDATWSLGPKNEWDIAAGVLLVQEAQGRVTDKKKGEFIFNRHEVKVDGIIAAAATAYERIFALSEGG
ncbi:3'(2'),5'-bisphosphate nucleotidase CysQ [Aquicella lusitana]|uniref:3'(2'),5'-bisphosphate nucleotidase n=1 Tax=Aquicella lusitana TaxID=254246 RepID=A0A370GYF4_9COXI|nr:3'(2'),5'-bisphosphate nucleotidase CysQ [Aquicella lusitana]RDI48687.1 3'(2'),5'-bisphosphate nucleotidase [Aquicella lusitana]VVC73936.1 Fructose-1, 6-bisphosphatase/inositol-1-monophosphatase [Aquicella lusitana]